MTTLPVATLVAGLAAAAFEAAAFSAAGLAAWSCPPSGEGVDAESGDCLSARLPGEVRGPRDVECGT